MPSTTKSPRTWVCCGCANECVAGAEPSTQRLTLCTDTAEQLAELAFEKFQAPAFFLSKNAVLTAFASGRGTALVLDVGGGVTSATAVHDGYVLGRPMKRHLLGGDLLNEIALKSWELRNPAQEAPVKLGSSSAPSKAMWREAACTHPRAARVGPQDTQNTSACVERQRKPPFTAPSTARCIHSST